MKKIIIIFALFGILFISKTNILKAENISDAGFAPAPIWFSKYPVFVDDNLRVYTALYNNSEYNISGEVFFFNKGIFINKTKFEMLPKSGNNDVWINWIAEKGDIEIGAEIKSLAIRDAKGNLVFNISLEENELIKNKINIDYKKENEEVGQESEKSQTQTEDETDSSQEEKDETDNEKTILDKLDSTVMGFLNKITQNKIDEAFDIIGGEQIKKLESKKDNLKNKTSNNLENNSEKLETTKISTTTTGIYNDKESQVVTQKKIDEEEIKNKISSFLERTINKVYLFILTVLIFLLNHKLFLFVFIFFTIYLIIKKIIRFFLG